MIPTRQNIADGRRWEGDRLVAYLDSKGLWTQGRGRRVQPHAPDINQLTLEQWFADDWTTANNGALRLVPNLDHVDTVRADAMRFLVMNMGFGTVGLFGPMLSFFRSGAYPAAAYHLMVNTKGTLTPYVTDVGARAAETALRIATGTILPEFLAP